MPTYSYQCKKCEAVLDVFHSISANPMVKCPSCGGSCKRLIGTGAGIIFKGSGFYQTDYKNGGGKASSATDSKSTPKSESKPANKTESSSDSKPAAKPSTTSSD